MMKNDGDRMGVERIGVICSIDFLIVLISDEVTLCLYIISIINVAERVFITYRCVPPWISNDITTL